MGMRMNRRMGTTLAGTLAVALLAGISHASILSSSYTAATATDPGSSIFVNLADEGSADWAIWNRGSTGDGAATTVSGAGLIGNLYRINGSSFSSTSRGSDLAFSTTPGDTTVSPVSGVIYNQPLGTAAVGVGLDITLPTLDIYTVRVYVGGYNADSSPLTATLGTGTPITFTEDFGKGDGDYKDAGILELQLQADSLNADENVLHVAITVGTPGDQNAHVFVQGATVSVPEPASGVLAMLGLGGLCVISGRWQKHDGRASR